ncbi:delta-like protein 1 [Asterias rubens]|uniref:delta-like protein 1 n=1 Tax=Asterias rubens TaxID=7604 RepID=UPI0014558E6D|nr:delta-like protein 1 [Asterias rubens]
MGRLRLSWRYITVLTVYLITIFTKVTGTEKFELELSSFTNALALDTEGNCCRSGSDGECTTCETFFRICLLEYMRDIPSDVENTQACTFGEKITPVLGDNSFNIPKGLAEENNFVNPLKVPLNFAWPGTFTLIVQAFHDVTSLGPQEGSERQLLTRVAFQQFLNVSERWTNRTHTEESQELAFSYRVVCNDNYHGPSCSAYCRPKDDHLGHWSCDANGQRVCLDGWVGEFCFTAVCAEGCAHGSCDIPGTCRCSYGWEGELCDQCIPIEGCVHGFCEQPGECTCHHGWADSLCDQDIYYCTNWEPCKNGATCQNRGPNGYTCYCAPGFTGADCSEAVVCPCENGGTCQSTAEQGYVCACPSGFTGRHCEHLIPLCTCSNGGTCIMNQDGYHYQCMCPEGFTGNRCETTDYCSTDPCVNGGTCINTLTGFSCSCPDGYTGNTCSMNVCPADVCKNGGTCVADFDNMRCLCARGYTGVQCEIELTECQLTTPCAHGSTCVDHEIYGYECLCHVGYTGRNCTVPSACLSNECLNGGTCSPDLINPLEFVCSCTSGWTGKTCGISADLEPSTTTKMSSPATKVATDARPSPGGGGVGGGTISPFLNNPRDLSDVTQIAIYVSFGIFIIILIIILIIVVYRRQHVDHHHHARSERDLEKPDSTPNNRHMYRDNFSQEEKVLPLLSISSKVCNTESDNFSKSKCKDFSMKETYHESLPVEKISTQECMSYVPQTRHSLPRLCDSDDSYYYYDEKASQLKRTESLHSTTCQSTESTPRHNIKCSIVQISAVIEDSNPKSVNRNSQCYSVHLNEERSTPVRLQATEV